jgi:hypothetical protein
MSMVNGVAREGPSAKSSAELTRTPGELELELQ